MTRPPCGSADTAPCGALRVAFPRGPSSRSGLRFGRRQGMNVDSDTLSCRPGTVKLCLGPETDVHPITPIQKECFVGPPRHECTGGSHNARMANGLQRVAKEGRRREMKLIAKGTADTAARADSLDLGEKACSIFSSGAATIKRLPKLSNNFNSAVCDGYRRYRVRHARFESISAVPPAVLDVRSSSTSRRSSTGADVIHAFNLPFGTNRAMSGRGLAPAF